MPWVAGHTARLFHRPGQHSPPACQQQAGAGSGKESQFTVSTKSAGGGTGISSVLHIQMAPCSQPPEKDLQKS